MKSSQEARQISQIKSQRFPPDQNFPKRKFKLIIGFYKKNEVEQRSKAFCTHPIEFHSTIHTDETLTIVSNTQSTTRPTKFNFEYLAANSARDHLDQYWNFSSNLHILLQDRLSDPGSLDQLLGQAKHSIQDLCTER